MPDTEKRVLIEKTPKQNQATNENQTKNKTAPEKPETCEVRRGNTWLESSERGQIRS